MRQDLAELYTADLILRLLQERSRQAREAGRRPGPEGSVAKLVNSRLQQRAAAIRLSLVGPNGAACDSADSFVRGLIASFVGSPAARIGGGTDEVQKNILGERVLGLPREPSSDRGVPFREVLQRSRNGSFEPAQQR
jgi:alkylation response protein AidB-like acyl-CoA dehydrogenase